MGKPLTHPLFRYQACPKIAVAKVWGHPSTMEWFHGKGRLTSDFPSPSQDRAYWESHGWQEKEPYSQWALCILSRRAATPGTPEGLQSPLRIPTAKKVEYK